MTDSIFWSEHDQSIYYADFITSGNQSSIFRYDYNTQIVHGAYIDGESAIAYLVPVEQCGEFDGTNNNLYLCGAQHDNFLIEWNGSDASAVVVDTVFSIEADVPSSHMDLGAQNHQGQFIAGTTHNEYCAGPSNSSLYTYTIADGVRNIYTGFQSTAGLAFVGDKIYHNDVCQQSIVELRQDCNGNCNAPTTIDLHLRGDKIALSIFLNGSFQRSFFYDFWINSAYFSKIFYRKMAKNYKNSQRHLATTL